MRIPWIMMLAACGSDASTAPDATTSPDALACGVPAAGAAGERVATTSGVLHGAIAGATWSYLGVPFASAPVGALRFAPPVAPACPAAEVAATTLGASCPQIDDSGAFTGDEDCLHLNLWAPAAAAMAARPVMVFVHGGGNVQGTASDPIYGGDRLATAGDIIVVTIDYRLGPLGFLDQATLAAENGAAGNYGLLDQIAALQWVKTNIAAFGGDPANVTVFGESAGARDTCSLVAAPGAAGLFQRAIVESGSCAALPTRAIAQQTGDQVVAALGCTGDLPACLRSHTAAEVIAAVPTSASILVSTPFQPEIDGTIQPVQPAVAIAAGTHHHVPFMIGSNADETGKQVPAIADEAAYEAAVTAQFGTAIGNQVLAQYPVSRFPTPRAAYVRVTTDARFVCPTRTFARDFAAGQTEPTYRYLFQYPATLFGAVHGIELPFVFGTLDTIVVNGTAHVPTSTELAVSAAMQADWTSFARTGVPAGAPTWPAYVTATDPARTYDAATGVVAGIRTADCDFWDGLH